uniref:Uncharacterized protein n=1 Tax=Bursaphelenchus xylophilus TaxID=6326 RepID=A0A1I7SLZ4_BURXY
MYVNSVGLTPLPHQLRYFVRSTRTPRIQGIKNINRFSTKKPSEDKESSDITSTLPGIANFNSKEMEAMLLDPELKSLKSKISDGIEAQRELKARLRRLNIQTRYRAVKTATKTGDSWKKPLLKQLGVRITKQKATTKRRSEGKLKNLKTFKPHKYVKTGRAEQSNLITKRFYSDKPPPTQVQVEPSKVVAEIQESVKKALNKVFSSGKLAQIDDFDEVVVKKKHRHESPKSFALPKKFDLYPTQPAFCRRCYKFFSTIIDADVTKVYQYCCTVGNHKSRILQGVKLRTL